MSESLHKIDFAVVISVKNANPNGDPLLGARPRITADGFGMISAECLKRKIRNRLQDLGAPIFVVSSDRNTDDYATLQERAEAFIPKETISDPKAYASSACSLWTDVRAFGQLFAFPASSKKRGRKGKSADVEISEESIGPVSVGVRGPVTIQPAISITPVELVEMKITKSVNSLAPEANKSRSSDTLGDKFYVPFGVYVTCGSINPFLAEKTGFSREDANLIHEAMKTMFENDESASRPSGSIEVQKVYWWEHENKNGSQPSGVVHRSISIKTHSDYPTSMDDIDFEVKSLPGVNLNEYSIV